MLYDQGIECPHSEQGTTGVGVAATLVTSLPTPPLAEAAMRLNRSNRERLTDAMLSLVLLNTCASENGSIGDRLKVTKLLFLATYELFAQQTRAFNFSFYRYHHGPFTTELYETWGELGWIGFLEVPPGPTGQIALTATGLKAAEHYHQRLDNLGNVAVLQAFKHVSDTYASLPTDELLKRVYGMEVTPLGWQQPVRIGDAPMGTYFTCVLEAEESRASVLVDDAIANEFFNELPRGPRPQGIADAVYRDIYASAVRGTKAERAGLPATEVSRSELERKLRGTG